jgi:hypothetical protein
MYRILPTLAASLFLVQAACSPVAARLATESVVSVLAAGDAAHADHDDAIAYRVEARERRESYIRRRGDDLPADVAEAIRGGYVREGMTKEEVEASVGVPQQTLSTRTEKGLELTWSYTNALQLSDRGWIALEVAFRQEFMDEEQLEWLREHPEALLSGDATGMIPEYRVVSAHWIK